MTDQNERDQQIHAVMELIMGMNRMHHRVAEKRMSELGIHRSQHRLLMYLSRTGRLPAQKELAKRLDVSCASVANMLKRLESGGYIARNALQSDGRCNEVEITELGNRVIERSKRIFNEIDRQMFEGFDGQEIETLRAHMTKISANLRSSEEEIGGLEPGCGEMRHEREVFKI